MASKPPRRNAPDGSASRPRWKEYCAKPDHDHSPFAEYLRQLDMLLADLPRERRGGIRRELLAHLDDAAAEQGADPSDPGFQALVIDQLGACGQVAAGFGAVHGSLCRTLQRMAYVGSFFGGLLGIFAHCCWPSTGHSPV